MSSPSYGNLSKDKISAYQHKIESLTSQLSSFLPDITDRNTNRSKSSFQLSNALKTKRLAPKSRNNQKVVTLTNEVSKKGAGNFPLVVNLKPRNNRYDTQRGYPDLALNPDLGIGKENPAAHTSHHIVPQLNSLFDTHSDDYNPGQDISALNAINDRLQALSSIKDPHKARNNFLLNGQLNSQRRSRREQRASEEKTFQYATSNMSSIIPRKKLKRKKSQSTQTPDE